MKKFLVVLTLVLVASFAFAAVTGYVEAKYTFDFTDAKKLTYDIEGKHSKVSFTISTEQAKVDGSNKPYATVTVDVKIAGTFAEKKQILEYDGYEWDISEDDDFTFGVVLSDFRIVGEDWEIDFLKAVGVGDYAKSAWEVDDNATESKRKPLDAPWDFTESKGITFTYNDYKLGFTAERREEYDYAFFSTLRAESKEFTLAEGVTGQTALAVGASKFGSDAMTFDFGASVKADYATDDLTVNGAADLQYVAKTFDADVSVKVAVKPVTVDVYYATSLQAGRLHSLYVLDDDVKNILSVKAVVALDPVTVTVYGEDLVNADRLLAVKEEGKFGALSEDAQFGIYPSLDKIEDIVGMFFKNILFANAGVGYDVNENLSVNAHAGYMRMNFRDDVMHIDNFVFQAGAEYKLEKVTLAADAYLGKEHGKFGDASYDSDLLFGCEVSASSDKLVENAVLSATLHIDKNGVIKLYDTTLVDAYAGDDPAPAAGGMYFQVGCKVTF